MAEPIRQTRAEAAHQDKLGCLDMIAATGGMGCASAIRGGILLGALLVVYFFLQLGGGASPPSSPLPSGGMPHVLTQGLHGGALILPYFFYLKKQLGRRVVDQLHAGVDILEQTQAVTIS